jgi:hypothetical protein
LETPVLELWAALGLWAACWAKPAGTSSNVLANAIRARELPVFLIVDSITLKSSVVRNLYVFLSALLWGSREAYGHRLRCLLVEVNPE